MVGWLSHRQAKRPRVQAHYSIITPCPVGFFSLFQVTISFVYSTLTSTRSFLIWVFSFLISWSSSYFKVLQLFTAVSRSSSTFVLACFNLKLSLSGCHLMLLIFSSKHWLLFQIKSSISYLIMLIKSGFYVQIFHLLTMKACKQRDSLNFCLTSV